MSHTPRPVMDPVFWRERLAEATRKGAVYQSVFVCPPDRWARIGDAHRKILAAHVKPGMSLLDVGCGYGRLLTLMPDDWRGTAPYLGVDLSPDFIGAARQVWGEGPGHQFWTFDIRHPLFAQWMPDGGKFDLAVLISVRGMVRRECGDNTWNVMHANIKAAADSILYLEYDADEPYELEVVA